MGLEKDGEYISQNPRSKHIMHSDEATEENFYKRAIYKSKGDQPGLERHCSVGNEGRVTTPRTEGAMGGNC